MSVPAGRSRKRKMSRRLEADGSIASDSDQLIADCGGREMLQVER